MLGCGATAQSCCCFMVVADHLLPVPSPHFQMFGRNAFPILLSSLERCQPNRRRDGDANLPFGPNRAELVGRQTISYR
jgi:hypothetical protein